MEISCKIKYKTIYSLRIEVIFQITDNKLVTVTIAISYNFNLDK